MGREMGTQINKKPNAWSTRHCPGHVCIVKLCNRGVRAAIPKQGRVESTMKRKRVSEPYITT